MRHLILASLLLAGLFCTMPARAFGECSAPTYVTAFDRAGLPNNTCYEIARAPIRHSGGTGKIRLLGVEGERGFQSQDAMAAALLDLAGRIGTAMTAMGGLRVDEVSVLLTRIPNPEHGTDESFDAMAGNFSKHGECFVTYYWPMHPESEDYFKFLIAHEVFHCITDATVFHANSVERTAGNRWWFEGTAEYFANLVYPGTGFSDGYVDEFDQRSPTAPLWSFQYPSVVFFLWLSQQESPAAVSRFVRNIASVADDPHAGLRRTVSAVTWKQFSQDYLDAQIRQPGGRQVPVHPSAGRRIVIDGPATPRAEAEPFVVDREHWRFRRGKVYQLQQLGISPGLSVSFSRDGGEWQSPPDTVLACDEDVVFRVLATTVDEAGEATYRAQPRPGMESPSACCLVGEWRPTDEARAGELAFLRETGGGAIAAAGGELSCDAPQGDWRLRFLPDGRGELEWQDFGLGCQVAGMGGAFTQRWVRSGSKTFEWASAVEGAAQVRHLANTMTMHLTLDLGPRRVVDTTTPDPGPSIPEYGIGVTCLRDDLRVEGFDGLGPRSETYRRVPPPAAPADTGSEGQD